MMLHLLHAAQQGHSKAYIRTVDTEVVVSALSHFSLQSCGLALGQENHLERFQFITLVRSWDLNVAKFYLFSMHLLGVMSHQLCLELGKRQHGMHGNHSLK